VSAEDSSFEKSSDGEKIRANFLARTSADHAQMTVVADHEILVAALDQVKSARAHFGDKGLISYLAMHIALLAAHDPAGLRGPCPENPGAPGGVDGARGRVEISHVQVLP
jgi:hypothetical protein